MPGYRSCLGALIYSFLLVPFVNSFFLAAFTSHTQFKEQVAFQALQYQNLNELFHFGKSNAANPFCLPGNSDYWKDAEGITRYVNHTCRPTCSQVNSGEPCIPLVESIFSETQDSLFVVTHDQLHSNQGQHNYFASSAEATVIKMEYAVGIPQVPWYQSQPSTWHRGTSQNTETFVLDHHGQIWRHFDPGADISFSLSEIIHLAGVDSLDAINPLAGTDFSPSATEATPARPTLRLTGMEIGVDLDCGMQSAKAGQRKCTISVHSKPSSWVSSASATADGTIRASHGVRVRLHVTGKELSFDVNAVFLNIASSMIYFKLPQTILFLVALYFCGHVSDVYRTIVYRRFNLAQEAGAMAMRLLEHEVTFTELEAIDDDDHAGLGYIDKVSVAGSLEHILSRRTHTLDTTEMRQMVDFCVSKVSKKFRGATEMFASESRVQAFFTEICESLNTLYGDLKEAFGFVHMRADHTGETVDVDKFASACSSLEMIGLSDLVKLFDKDRSMSVLESLFMPLEFKACILEDRAAMAENIETKMRPKRQGSHALDRKILGMIHNFERLTAEVQTYRQQHEAIVEELRTVQMHMCSQREETLEPEADNSHVLALCSSSSSCGATKHYEFSL